MRTKVDFSQELTDFCRGEYPRLVGMLGLYTGDAMVAEELAQEALARTWNNWGKVRKLDKPHAWLHKVAVNLANSHFRRTAAERRARNAHRPTSIHHDGDAADRQVVREAIARLPKRQRTALVMRYYLDLPFAEIAELMGAPEPTVKSLTRRAIARLREQDGLADVKEVLNVT